jgi:transcriptional regulator with XRE-family HTH domain
MPRNTESLPTATARSSSSAPGNLLIPPSRRLGERIQARRREVGFRFAKDFASAMGWNASMVSRVESGERGLTERDVEQLARHMRVTPDWFSDGDEPPGRDLAGLADLIEEYAACQRKEVAILDRMADLLRRNG